MQQFNHNLCFTMTIQRDILEENLEQMYCKWILLKILHFIFIRIVCLPMENTILILERMKRHAIHWTMVKPSLTYKLFEKYFVFMVRHISHVLLQQPTAYGFISFRFVSFKPKGAFNSIALKCISLLLLLFPQNFKWFKFWSLKIACFVHVLV